MGKSVVLVLAGVTALFAGRAQPQGFDPVPSEDRPLWQVDLHKFGYDTSSQTARLQKFVDFTDSGHLAVAWLTLDRPVEAKKTGALTPRPAHLHVLILDARTGQKQGLQEWSTPSTPVRFVGLPDGKFLTCTGMVLRLFSSSFELVRDRSLASDLSCSGGFPARQGASPSKRSLFLSSRHSDSSYENAVLDTETLQTLNARTETFPVRRISDHWLVASCGQPRGLCIRGADSPWQPLLLGDTQIGNTGVFFFGMFFVSDGTFAAEARNKMAVATVDGTELFRVELPDKRLFSEVAPSGGDRFAIMENRLRGLKNEMLDMYPFDSNDRVVIFSIAGRRAIYAVRVKGVSPWLPLAGQRDEFALSPDGSLLAVIADANLKAYSLPAAVSQ
jgi:hypothetical protein